MSRIYKITDRTNNKVYIGQTKRDIYKRFAEHINGNYKVNMEIRLLLEVGQI